jgi:SAM-dependent methyltransferase
MIDIIKPDINFELSIRDYLESLSLKFKGCFVNFPRGVFYSTKLIDFYYITTWLEHNRPSRVLDCGSLFSFRAIVDSQFCDEYYAIDNGLALIKPSQAKFLDLFEWKELFELKAKPGSKFLFGHLECLTFEESYFDVVTCVSTLESIFEDELAIKNIKRCLKKDGTLLIITKINFCNQIHYFKELQSRFYSPDSLFQLLDFGILRAVADGTPADCAADKPWPQFVNIFVECVNKK